MTRTLVWHYELPDRVWDALALMWVDRHNRPLFAVELHVPDRGYVYYVSGCDGDTLVHTGSLLRAAIFDNEADANLIVAALSAAGVTSGVVVNATI